MATIDILVRMRQMPVWERGTQLDDLSLDGGGPVGTALVAAARLGARVGYLGTAGNDEAAELKLRLLSKYGVDTSQVVRRPSAESQMILVCVNAKSGERVFSSTPRTGCFPLQPDEINRGVCGASQVPSPGRFSHAGGAAGRGVDACFRRHWSCWMRPNRTAPYQMTYASWSVEATSSSAEPGSRRH